LFSAHPYADVAVADIARAAGVSPGLIEFHFGSKRALYAAVVQAAADVIRDGLRAVPGPPSLERLRRGVLFYAEYASTHRAGFLSLLRSGQESPLPEVARIVEALRAEIAGQILADLVATRGRPSDGPAGMLAVRGYLGYVDAVITAWLSLPDAEHEQVPADLIADLAVGAFTGSVSAALAG
jgi:AcrR family transcriptional regulator